MSRQDDFEAWVMQGVELSVEPTTPIGDDNRRDFDVESRPDSIGHRPRSQTSPVPSPAAISSRSGATPLVLRV